MNISIICKIIKPEHVSCVSYVNDKQTYIMHSLDVECYCSKSFYRRKNSSHIRKCFIVGLFHLTVVACMPSLYERCVIIIIATQQYDKFYDKTEEAGNVMFDNVLLWWIVNYVGFLLSSSH